MLFSILLLILLEIIFITFWGNIISVIAPEAVIELEIDDLPYLYAFGMLGGIFSHLVTNLLKAIGHERIMILA